ncbi:MAG: ankyrin repeat domain-containing protein [Clostridia bacterium]|nr:ankyrin repeat domain-containing protein [Clostridia bacterium]
MESRTIIQTTGHLFPSLYSLDPKTATLADAKKCLEAGCDPDEIDDNGEWGAVAYFAIHSDNVPLIRYLLKEGKPKKLSSYKNDMPLLAVVKNHGVMEALFDYGFDVNETDSEGRTALMLLSKETENQEFVLHLIRRGADVNKEDANGWNALDYAIKYEKTPEGEHNCYACGIDSGTEYVVGALFENGAKARRPQTLDALAQSVSSQEKIILLEEWTDLTEDEVREALEKDPANRERIASYHGFLWYGFLRDPEDRDNPFADLDYRLATAQDVKKALDEGGDPNDFNGCQFQGAYFLATARNRDAVAYLFERCPDLYLYTDEWGGECYRTILSNIKDFEIARMVAENAPETINEIEYGTIRNSIGVAAVHNVHPDFIRHLIDLGVPVRMPLFYESDEEEESGVCEPELLPLEEALDCNRNPEIMQVLLDAGCEVRKKVLLKYLYRGPYCVKKAEILLSTGLFKTDELLKALMREDRRYGKNDDSDIVSSYGSYWQEETNARDIRTDILDSPMIVNALKYGNSKLIVPFLKQSLKDINHRNSNWETPLMIAALAKRKNTTVINALLEAGADPTLKNNDGKTLYDQFNLMKPENIACLRAFQMKNPTINPDEVKNSFSEHQ